MCQKESAEGTNLQVLQQGEEGVFSLIKRMKYWKMTKTIVKKKSFWKKNVSDIYQAEGESTQNYFLEESASVLQEQQRKSNEIAFSGIDGERSGADFHND